MPVIANQIPYYGWIEDVLGDGTRLNGPLYGGVSTSGALANGRYKVRFIGGTLDDVANIRQGSAGIAADANDYAARSSDDPFYIRVISDDNRFVSVLFPDNLGFVTITPVALGSQEG